MGNTNMQSPASPKLTSRITSIDFVRGVVMVIMALDHVRMYFAHETWYADPTDLATTTPLLFFTRWITHFCAPVFVFLAGTSAFLYGVSQPDRKRLAGYLLTRGIWLLLVEIVIVTFGWTFDFTFGFIILQVIWAIGISMIVLSALVFLPWQVILAVGILILFGHNLFDKVHFQGNTSVNVLWYILHQPHRFAVGEHLINIVYPVLPWIGLMALGYVLGNLFRAEFPAARRRFLLLASGIAAILLFLLLRSLNQYGESSNWQRQSTAIFSLLSFLNTTKYPPSLLFLLMTMGPALMLLAWSERFNLSDKNPLVVFGRVPLFFYVVHIYLIHAAATLALTLTGWDWREYILSAQRVMSGRLSRFGFGLEAVYVIWLAVVIVLYPLCRWYQQVRVKHPENWWLKYL